MAKKKVADEIQYASQKLHYKLQGLAFVLRNFRPEAEDLGEREGMMGLSLLLEDLSSQALSVGEVLEFPKYLDSEIENCDGDAIRVAVAVEQIRKSDKG